MRNSTHAPPSSQTQWMTESKEELCFYYLSVQSCCCYCLFNRLVCIHVFMWCMWVVFYYLINIFMCEPDSWLQLRLINTRSNSDPHRCTQAHVRLNSKRNGCAEHFSCFTSISGRAKSQIVSEALDSPGPVSSRCWRGRGFPGGWVDSGSGRNAEWDKNTGGEVRLKGPITIENQPFVKSLVSPFFSYWTGAGHHRPQF